MLTEIKFAPGVDKQDTSVGAQGRWVDSDNVRWRYGLPEKVGGWQSLLNDCQPPTFLGGDMDYLKKLVVGNH